MRGGLLVMRVYLFSHVGGCIWLLDPTFSHAAKIVGPVISLFHSRWHMSLSRFGSPNAAIAYLNPSPLLLLLSCSHCDSCLLLSLVLPSLLHFCSFPNPFNGAQKHLTFCFLGVSLNPFKGICLGPWGSRSPRGPQWVSILRWVFDGGPCTTN